MKKLKRHHLSRYCDDDVFCIFNMFCGYCFRVVMKRNIEFKWENEGVYIYEKSI